MEIRNTALSLLKPTSKKIAATAAIGVGLAFPEAAASLTIGFGFGMLLRNTWYRGGHDRTHEEIDKQFFPEVETMRKFCTLVETIYGLSVASAIYLTAMMSAHPHNQYEGEAHKPSVANSSILAPPPSQG